MAGDSVAIDEKDPAGEAAAWAQLETRLSSRTDYPIRDPEAVIKRLCNLLFAICLEAEEPKKPRSVDAALLELRNEVGLHISTFPMTLNGKSNLAPAKEEAPQVTFKRASKGRPAEIIWPTTKPADYPANWNAEGASKFLWVSAYYLSQEIHKNPSRLKICPFCNKLFWDSETKRGNRTVCITRGGACQKKANVQRVLKSIAKRRRSISRPTTTTSKQPAPARRRITQTVRRKKEQSK